jgi:hypothetical protein
LRGRVAAELCAHAPNLLFEFGKVPLGQRPHLLHVEAEVFMDKDVSESNDFRSGDVWMALFQALRHAASSLTDYLQIVDHPYLNQLVLPKSSRTVRDPRLDLLDGLENVAEAVCITPHKAIASR